MELADRKKLWISVVVVLLFSGPRAWAQFDDSQLFYAHKRLRIAALHIVDKDKKIVVANKRGYPIYFLNRNNVITDTLHTVPPEQVIFYNDTTLLFQGQAYSERICIQADKIKSCGRVKSQLPDGRLLLAPLAVDNLLFGLVPGSGSKKYYVINLDTKKEKLIAEPSPRIDEAFKRTGISFKYAYQDGQFKIFDKLAATLLMVNTTNLQVKSLLLPVEKDYYWHYYYDHVKGIDYFLKVTRREKDNWEYNLYRYHKKELQFVAQLPAMPNEIVGNTLHYVRWQRKTSRHYLVPLGQTEQGKTIVLPELQINSQ